MAKKKKAPVEVVEELVSLAESLEKQAGRPCVTKVYAFVKEKGFPGEACHLKVTIGDREFDVWTSGPKIQAWGYDIGDTFLWEYGSNRVQNLTQSC